MLQFTLYIMITFTQKVSCFFTCCTKTFRTLLSDRYHQLSALHLEGNQVHNLLSPYFVDGRTYCNFSSVGHDSVCNHASIVTEVMNKRNPYTTFLKSTDQHTSIVTEVMN